MPRRRGRGGDQGGDQGGARKAARKKVVIVPVTPMVCGVPAEKDSVYAFPLKDTMARITPEKAYEMLTSQVHGEPRFKTMEPYGMFVPMEAMRGRTLIDIDTSELGSRALRSFARFMLAQVVRDGARLFVSLRQRNNVNVGYYWVLYEREVSEEDARAAALAEIEEKGDGEEAKGEEAKGGDDDDEEGGGGGGGGDGEEAAVMAQLGQVVDQLVGGGGGRGRIQRREVRTDNMPIAHWMVRRIMSSATSIRQLAELSYQHDDDDRTGGRFLSAEQLRWWTMLSDFASPRDLAQRCADVLGSGEEFVSQEREKTAVVNDLLRAALTMEKAALSCAMAMRRSDEDVVELQRNEMLAMRHNNIIGIPLDGVDSFYIPPSHAHPRVLSRYVMPHMTPAINVNSDVYIKHWQRARASPDGAQYGEDAPNDTFFYYFRDKVGATTERIDSGQFETSVHEVGPRVTRTLAADRGARADARRRAQDAGQAAREAARAQRQHDSPGGAPGRAGDRPQGPAGGPARDHGGPVQGTEPRRVGHVAGGQAVPGAELQHAAGGVVPVVHDRSGHGVDLRPPAPAGVLLGYDLHGHRALRRRGHPAAHHLPGGPAGHGQVHDLRHRHEGLLCAL
jgi:hypothetical protein